MIKYIYIYIINTQDPAADEKEPGYKLRQSLKIGMKMMRTEN